MNQQQIQVRISPKFNLVVKQWLLSFIGIAYRSMSEKFLTGVTPKAHFDISASSRKLETWSALNDQEAAQQAGDCLFQACQGSFFQVAQVISTSLKQFSWSLLFVYVCLGRKDSSLSQQFGGLPQDFELFVSEIKELPAGENSPHFITSCILMGFPPRCLRGNHYTIEEITTQCLYDYIQFIYSSANGHLYYFCFVSITRKRVS